MDRFKARILLIAIVITGSSCIFITSCRRTSMDGMIIFTQVKGKLQNGDFVTGDSWRYVPLSRIVALNPSKPAKKIKILTSGYYSACSPEISCDGKRMLFAGQLRQNEPWQIWEMDLGNSKVRQITFSQDNCTDPAYLPIGHLVFSRYLPGDSLKSGHSLFTCNLDGSGIKRITFNPATYFASSVLKDGRILSVSRQIFPHQEKSLFMVMRPDGTKSGLFYQGIAGNDLTSRGWETTDNKIVFIESGKAGHKGGDIISVNYNRPLHSRDNLTSDINGDFHSVSPEQSGQLLVSYRKSDSEPYAVCEFDPVHKSIGKVISGDKDFDEIEPVEVREYSRQRALPSEVHMDIKTGLLMCQDINLTDTLPSARPLSLAKTYNIDIMGLDSSLGDVQVEKDGSFYLRIIADKPFRISTIDEKGNVLQSCDWLWLRPNERRGCVGCHEDHELVPENRIPLSVKKSPVAIPTHLRKIKEKLIDTE